MNHQNSHLEHTNNVKAAQVAKEMESYKVSLLAVITVESIRAVAIIIRSDSVIFWTRGRGCTTHRGRGNHASQGSTTSTHQLGSSQSTDYHGQIRHQNEKHQY